MPYLTSVERIARQEGIEQGIEQGTLTTCRDNLISVLQLRFNPLPEKLIQQINSLTNVAVLKELLQQAITINSLEEFKNSIK